MGDQIKFTEARVELTGEDENKKIYSLYIKWMGDVPVDMKFMNGNNESIERDLKREEKSLFDLDVMKKMITGISPPEDVFVS